MVGIGVDIVEIERIQMALEKNDRFLERLFTNKERAYFEHNNYKYETIAGMFAAKEAVSKVLGTGISGFSWQDIEIDHSDLGQPLVILHGGAKLQAEKKSIKTIMVSISHCKSYAVANALGV